MKIKNLFFCMAFAFAFLAITMPTIGTQHNLVAILAIGASWAYTNAMTIK